jgi:hypothetical protein
MIEPERRRDRAGRALLIFAALVPAHVIVWWVWLNASPRNEDPWLALYAGMGIAQVALASAALRAALAARRSIAGAAGGQLVLSGLALLVAIGGTIFGAFVGIMGKALGGA